jgi:argininosuccinate lyase
VKAEAADDAVMPSYTHLQRAEPVLVAHWLLAYVEMILRDAARLGDCSARLNYCPLGSGAVAGATLALDRAIAARALGFTAPTGNSIDATSDRDFILEYLQALTFVGLHLSRFAEEITLFATAEFGFITLPEAFSTGSSAMPQKKNPDLTELIRAKVGRIHGAAEAVTLQLKGLPLAYNKDLQETQEQVFAVEFVPKMLALVARFISSTKAFPSAPLTRRSAMPCALLSRKALNSTPSLSTNSANLAMSSRKTFSPPLRSRLRLIATT